MADLHRRRLAAELEPRLVNRAIQQSAVTPVTLVQNWSAAAGQSR